MPVPSSALVDATWLDKLDAVLASFEDRSARYSLDRLERSAGYACKGTV